MKEKIIIGFFIGASLLFSGYTFLYTSGRGDDAQDDKIDEYGLIGNKAPELSKGEWINSSPHTLFDFEGKVVLLEFWTYGCYNCRNTIPKLIEWQKKYSNMDFTIIGVHTPEFGAEKNLANVHRQITNLGIQYSVVTDNEYQTWEAYHQQ